MKLLFEGYNYNPDDVKVFCNSAGKDLYGIRKQNGKAVFDCVGYFCSEFQKSEGKAYNDVVFILPKVLLNEVETEGTKEEPLAFGEFTPEELIDFDSFWDGKNTEIENSDEKRKLNEKKTFISQLAVWLYRAIDQYAMRQADNTSVEHDLIADLQTSRKYGDSRIRTYLDIILELFRFNKEHSRLFTYIALAQSGGNSRINWDKTISRKQPLLMDGVPFYCDFVTSAKKINFDEELVVLFYSVLMYLRERYHFRVVMTLNYKLIPPRKIAALLENGKGKRLLRSIRHNYFKDELVALWKLLYAFFDKSEKVSSGRYHAERLLVRKFNNVFEDMIDKLLSDSTENIPSKLKNQADGKIVDHIYRDMSLTGPEDVYFIGDSKYYLDKTDVEGNPVYKQFTYAKNVVQFNVGILDGKKQNNDSKPMRYRDELTEGYDITPNFFIRGMLDFGDLTGKDPKLMRPSEYAEKKSKEKTEPDEHTMWQFEDRLFDRDTLLIQTYNINFLYVMNAYISRGGNEEFRRTTRERFRTDILSRLNKRYAFYRIGCASEKAECKKECPLRNRIKKLVDAKFRDWIGKMYRVSDDSNKILLAFEKNGDDLDEEVQRAGRQFELFCTKLDKLEDF